MRGSGLQSAGCGTGTRPSGARQGRGLLCPFLWDPQPSRSPLPRASSCRSHGTGTRRSRREAAGWRQRTRPHPVPSWDKKDPIPWESGPESLSNHPTKRAVLSGRGPLFDFLPLWHAGGRAGWGPVCSKKPFWEVLFFFFFFPFPLPFRFGKRELEVHPGAPRCSWGAPTRVAHQNPRAPLWFIRGHPRNHGGPAERSLPCAHAASAAARPRRSHASTAPRSSCCSGRERKRLGT